MRLFAFASGCCFSQASRRKNEELSCLRTSHLEETTIRTLQSRVCKILININIACPPTEEFRRSDSSSPRRQSTNREEFEKQNRESKRHSAKNPSIIKKSESSQNALEKSLQTDSTIAKRRTGRRRRKF